MQIIPVLVPVEKDELLISYLYRLAFANGFSHTYNSFSKYFPTTWYGCWNAVVNIAKQIERDPIEFFLNTTTFSVDQLFMTREQHKDTVRKIVQMNGDWKDLHLPLPNYFKEAEVCKECALEDGEKRIIHRSLQVPGGYCYKHNRRTVISSPDLILTGDIHSIKDSRILPANKFPSLFDIAANDIAQGLLKHNIPLCYDDVITIIKHFFQTSRLFTARTFLEIADFDKNFFGKNARVQMDYMSDAFNYINDQNVNLYIYKNILMGLLSCCVNDYDGLVRVLPSQDGIMEELYFAATRQGYVLESEKVLPILKVRNVIDNSVDYVSIFSVLDGDINKEK